MILEDFAGTSVEITSPHEVVNSSCGCSSHNNMKSTEHNGEFSRPLQEYLDQMSDMRKSYTSHDDRFFHHSSGDPRTGALHTGCTGEPAGPDVVLLMYFPKKDHALEGGEPSTSSRAPYDRDIANTTLFLRELPSELVKSGKLPKEEE